jgi:hypothetical protein
VDSSQTGYINQKKVYDFVRLDFLDDKKGPSVVNAPVITNASDSGLKLRLSPGTFTGTSSSFFPTPVVTMLWGSCLKGFRPTGTDLPTNSNLGGNCSLFTEFQTVTSDVTFDVGVSWPSLVSSTNRDYFAYFQVANSYGSLNFYTFFVR